MNDIKLNCNIISTPMPSSLPPSTPSGSPTNSICRRNEEFQQSSVPSHECTATEKNKYKIKNEKRARKFIKHFKLLRHGENFYDKYTIVRNLSDSEINGRVSICKLIGTNDLYIVKQMKNKPCSYKELYIHSCLQSDYVVEIFDIYIDTSYLYIILEYCSDGDLFEKINGCLLTPNEALNIIYNISTLVKHVHRMGIIHGDLKLENILLDGLCMRLCDFGYSVFADCPNTSCYLYTNPYTAPEQLRYKYFTYSSDVWSLGIILYILIFDKYPFGYIDDDELTPYEMYNLIMNNKIGIPDNAPKHIKKILNGMLQIDPLKRYTLDKVRHVINKMKF